MASTHLVFTEASDTKVAIPKTAAVLVEHEGQVKVWEVSSADENYWVAKETFDELLKKLEE